MQTACRQASSAAASTSGRDCQTQTHSPVQAGYNRCCLRSRQPLQSSASAQRLLQASRPALVCRRQLKRSLRCLSAHHNGSNNSSNKGPVIVIDNYDSFTYNLCQVLLAWQKRLPPCWAFSLPTVTTSVTLQYLGDLGCEHVVYKNDEKTIAELRSLNPRGILLSPGPGQLMLVMILLQHSMKTAAPHAALFHDCFVHVFVIGCKAPLLPAVS